MPTPLVSVVLPVHNQADHLAAVTREYSAVLARIPVRHEILLVPNACRDQSVQVCQTLATELHCVRVFPLEGEGWGRAVRHGLQAARGDLLCYTNLARTTAADLSLLLIYAITFQSAVIKANRRIREGWRRRLGSLLYNLECRALFDLPYLDINGTPKVFPRAFGSLLRLTRDDDLVDAEFCIACRRADYPLLEVPILSSRRHGGASTTNYGSAFRMYVGALKLWRQRPSHG